MFESNIIKVSAYFGKQFYYWELKQCYSITDLKSLYRVVLFKLLFGNIFHSR